MQQKLSTQEREHFFLESIVRGHHIYKQIWTTHYGEILHAITKNNEVLLHERFAVALKRFKGSIGHGLLDNKRSSILGKGLEVPRECTLYRRSEDDQAAGEGLLKLTK